MHRTRTLLVIFLSLLVLLVLSSCMTPLFRMELTRNEPSVITVSGAGVVHAAPDAVTLQVSFTAVELTTREAQALVNRSVEQMLKIAETNRIPQDDIRTISLNFNPEYEWKDGERTLIGQRVRQSMSVTLKGIDSDIERLGLLLDGIGVLSGLEISSIVFFVEDTEALYQEARSLAFAKAQEKAQQFALQGEVTLGKPVSVSEYSQEEAARSTNTKMMLMESAAADYTGSQIPSGSFSVRASVTVQYAIK
ncbi:MAG: SIMPL domain-containing protein [Spirochaetia bacterium]|nr:SIMPL domain-containing protein [Spirochaetia bacterium]MCF7941674.1 SIMPL domain-containing protein [Spirochaetia bacterium]